jgi:hypothetical protein
MTEAEPGGAKFVQGKWLVLATFAIGLAMAGGAWWYQYNQARRSAEFWGHNAASLLVGNSTVKLVELGEPRDEASAESPAEAPEEQVDEFVAGRAVVREVDLTQANGLVHLRHSLTYDDNFEWERRALEPLAASEDWAFALTFSQGNRELVVLFPRDFTRMGRVVEWDRGPEVDVLPCPRLGPVIVKYLGEVGAM